MAGYRHHGQPNGNPNAEAGGYHMGMGPKVEPDQRGQKDAAKQQASRDPHWRLLSTPSHYDCLETGGARYKPPKAITSGSSGTRSFGSVTATTSSTVKPGTSSLRTNPPGVTSITAKSVTIR